jgi:hypothetical protein
MKLGGFYVKERYASAFETKIEEKPFFRRKRIFSSVFELQNILTNRSAWQLVIRINGTAFLGSGAA